MNKFFMIVGGILIWVVACFFLTSCGTLEKARAYSEAAASLNEKRDKILDDFNKGVINLDTATELLKELDLLKDKLRENAGGGGSKFLLEIIALLVAFGSGAGSTKIIPFLIKKFITNKTNG
jgi:hypothetical protein